MSFSADFIHAGHIKIIKEAAGLGELTIGILTDEVVAEYKRFPLLLFAERKEIIANIKGVAHVIPQTELSYTKNLLLIKPDIVVHGDDWRVGYLSNIRNEVIQTVTKFGGELVEFPYSDKEEYRAIETYLQQQTGIPDIRRKKLRQLLQLKPVLSVIEAHNGLTGLIAEETRVFYEGRINQFDGIWVSSLCDSTAKGKPDIELVDMSSRLRTVNDIMEVTSKPIILDGDSGGLTEHFVYNIMTLERIGVSAVIIEDKVGLKRNSLFGTEATQTQDCIEGFTEKIKAGKQALSTKEFLLIARIESLILEKGIADALTRAHAFVKAGADAIMIHSRQKTPDEVFSFCDAFRSSDSNTPLVVVPTTFFSVTEDELAGHGVNIVIYANHLIRSAFPAMKKAAELILAHRSAREVEHICMPINEILSVIPQNKPRGNIVS
jgi:phosphoenolpyruvate phosphomutase